MKNRRLEKRIKAELTDSSEPNLDNIIVKSQNMSENNNLTYDNVLTISRRRRVYSLLISSVLIGIMTIIGTVGIFMFTNADEPASCPDNDEYFGHECEVKWDYTLSIDDVNKTKNTEYKQFHGYMVTTSASATNYDGYIWVEYEKITESSVMLLTMRVFAYNNVGKEYGTLKNLGNDFEYGRYNVKYHYTNDEVIHSYKVYLTDIDSGYIYIIFIDDTECQPIESYLANLY